MSGCGPPIFRLFVAQDCVGGVLYPHDGTARADLVTGQFRDRATRAGVRFVFGTEAIGIDTSANRITRFGPHRTRIQPTMSSLRAVSGGPPSSRWPARFCR